ncbi:MAG: fyuA 12 [Phenylobacterium sp.]|nr:fyuA 12 [Phenylobacterium sp.]
MSDSSCLARAAGGAAFAVLASVGVARGQEATAPPPYQVHPVIVTAQKREQAADRIGMSITAATDEVLRTRGIDSVADLPRLVPGLTIQQSAYNSTSFTLRGVGFFNSDLATPPAVTIYLDEAPLPYPAMTKLVAFDLERVEVLRGPQGTLFGQNATGGAVNYIAAKPTEVFAAGADAAYGSLNRVLLGGYVSGPIGPRLTARLALQGRRGDAWQQSITRPGDRLGRIRQLQGRATIEWRPDEAFASRLTLTVTHDGSDSLAGQFIAARTSIAALAVPGLLAFPAVEKPRAADWTPVRPDTNTPFPYASDSNLYHATWRNDLRLGNGLSLTALSSFAEFRLAYGQDTDGAPFHVSEGIDRDGKVSTVFQELRLSSAAGRLTWLVGANYDHDNVSDDPLQLFADNDVSRVFLGVDPQAVADVSSLPSRLRATTYAIFGHFDYQATEQLRLEGAVRFNSDHRTFDNCSDAGSEDFARFWNAFRGGAPPATRVGDCFTIDPANDFRPVANVHRVLDQNSIPWRAGVDWTPDRDLLVFVNVSQGFKAGAAPTLGASTVAQFTPVPQESLLAYEAGVKASLFDRRAQLNASAFYYAYKDKQLRGALLDPAFGPLEALVSIPRSHAEGVDAQLIARPLDGLTIDASVTYVQTAIDRFTGFDALAHFGDQSGTPFPFSPKWHAVGDIEYAFPAWSDMRAFVGGSVTYNSKTFAGVGALDLLRVAPFVLVDLRAGVERRDGRYRLWIWGKNVGDTYYWSNVLAYVNAISRFVGEPATYGITLSRRF